MNQKTTYEITITQKLDQLPIPDLSELIWSRIEKELDADPGDVSDNNNPSPPSPSGRIIAGGLGLVVFIAFLINFLNDKQQNTVSPGENIQKETPATIREPNTPDDQSITPFISPRQMLPEKKNGQVLPPDTTTFVPQATGSPGLARDTASAIVIPGPAPVARDTVPTKKPRGVKGISPDDYKIIPKKDSL